MIRYRAHVTPTTRVPRARAIASRVEAWFDETRRELPWRRDYDPFHVWVAEVMAQQTRMEVILPFFEKFIARFPDLEQLAAAEEREVLALWSGLGYYRRARMLHAGARQVATGGLPSSVEELSRIPGIGRYTAGAIASIAFNRREPVVDGNVIRLSARLEAMNEPQGSGSLSRWQWEWAGALVAACESPRRLNQGLMELGAMICRPRNPRCAECPLSRFCKARKEGNPEAYPLKSQSRPEVAMTIPLFLAIDEKGRVLLRQARGRIAREMFHLPHGSMEILGTDDSMRFTTRERVGSFRHSITHRRIEFDLWRCNVRETIAEDDGDLEWIDPTALDRLPHPSYVRKALKLAGVAMI